MYMKKIYLALLLFVFAIGVFSFVRLSVTNGFDDDDEFGDDESDDFFEDNDDNGFDRNIESVKNVSPVMDGKISNNLLSKHGSVNDCWVAYNGKVYDISSYLPKHLGSAGAISPFCGTANGFKNAFEKKHGTKMVSTLMKFGVLMGDFDILGEI